MTNENARRRSESSQTHRSPKIRAKKSLGQNFLVDEAVIRSIVGELNPRDGETIVEIGPGQGALTSYLVETAAQIVAIEFDRDLAPLLNEKFRSCDNFVLIQADALGVDICGEIAPVTTARLVANLPYNMSTAILQRLLEQRKCLSELVLMLQREVAARITAPPSTSDRGYLSVFVEAYADVEKLFDVAPQAFRPSPKVWSTVVRLRPRPGMVANVRNEALLWRLVSAGFAQRRKTIFNNLRNARSLFSSEDVDGEVSRVLQTSNIESKRRAESLNLEEWIRVATAIEVT